MFGDSRQRDHMMAGVRAAHASPNTPAHLRPHLARRLQGGTMAFPPRKTIVGPTGRTPIVTRTGRTNTTPMKTLVGPTSRPPVKTVVGNTAAPPPKTLVGSTAAPPLKTTPANLGKGGINPLGRGFDTRPNNAANPRFATRSLGRGDGNLGRSVAPMPPPAGGPPNPVLQNEDNDSNNEIVAGGMGPTAKRIGIAGRGRTRARRPVSGFYGG